MNNNELSTNLASLGTDCISRQEAIDATWEDTGYTDPFNVMTAIRDRIRQLPTIQPKRGRWISADAIFGGVPFYCSECGENTRDTVMGEPRWNFCPNCGADMRGEQ